MEQFVKAAQQGDPLAWNRLYRQHYPWMYATALRICGNTADARDSVQECFISAYLHLHQLKDFTAFAGWLKSILVRFCLRNSRHSESAPGKDCVNEIHAWQEDDICRKLDLYERQTRMFFCLDCLSDALQSVLLLRYFSEWTSYDNIAELLGIPVGTVRSRLNQAKEKLSQRWAESDADNDSAFRRATGWNDIYFDYFSGVYTSLVYREKLIGHLDKNVQIRFTSGKTATGRNQIQQLIEEDMVYGNTFDQLEVTSSGNISIIECRNINSNDYPDRCPEKSIFVLHRTGNTVSRFYLHNSR